MFFIQLLLIFWKLTIVHVVEFRIDGQVDIGPKLNYKVQIAQVTQGDPKLALRLGKIAQTLLNTPHTEPTTIKTLTIEKVKDDKFHAKLIVKDKSVTNFLVNDEFKTKINLSLNFENGDDGENKRKTKDKEKKLKLVEYEISQTSNPERNSVPWHRAVHAAKKIKDVDSLQKYFIHLYNRALRALDALRDRNKIKVEKAQLHKIKHMYMDKIHEYIVTMENQTLRTELGWQKAILNTLEVSNKILNKLLDRIEPPLKISQSLRNDVLPTYAIQKEFETDEYYFICSEYNICKTQRSFSDFLAEIFTMILKTEDRDVKQASDALTEVIGDLDYQKIMDFESHRQFSVAIKRLEQLDSRDTRAVLTVVKNMIVHRNMPIKIFGSENMALINKTVAFQTILNEFDMALPGNKENVKKWDHITSAVEQWSRGEKERILDICKKFIKTVNKGIDYMSNISTEIIRNNIRFLFAETYY